ncbi:MAG: cyclic nucleotide-binding domain-containing protein [Anaerolineales bacterium]|nr:cyclic nucleotide-binding domain-containing protein [Anaerolineales bacterium]
MATAPISWSLASWRSSKGCSPDERSFGMRGPGDIIGEMSLIDPSQPRSASVRTKTAAELLVVTRAEFDDLSSSSPHSASSCSAIRATGCASSENATIRDLQTKNVALTQAYR